MSNSSILSSHVSEILCNYHRALMESDSPLASVPERWQQCRAQAEAILGECIRILDGEPVLQPNLHQATREVAVQRALQEVPIAESIRAGILLWRSAFPVLRQIISESACEELRTLQVLDALHQSIGVRLYIGAAAHENTGLARLAIMGEENASMFSAIKTDLDIIDSSLPLTIREQQVLHEVSCGLSNRAIASKLGITEATIKRHMGNIFRKLGATSRVDALNKANWSSRRKESVR